ncbi:MAG: hypothetical protein DME65_15415 [Verrucomicrobia bacterium]|nr:MAG: hypothetical protein DME65_15415 [Verrucomicrobiota bacterium]
MILLERERSGKGRGLFIQNINVVENYLCGSSNRIEGNGEIISDQWRSSATPDEIPIDLLRRKAQ